MAGRSPLPDPVRVRRKEKASVALDSSTLAPPSVRSELGRSWAARLGEERGLTAVLEPLFQLCSPEPPGPHSVCEATLCDSTSQPAKWVALQKGWQEPCLATQRRSPTPAGCETTEVTCARECGEGFFSPHAPNSPWSSNLHSRSPNHGPPSVLGMETLWAISPGGTLALLAGCSPAPPFPTGSPTTKRWLAGGARGEPAMERGQPCRAHAAPCAPRPALPAGCSPGDRFLRSVLSCPPLPTIHGSPAIPEMF